jgi:hypothetical protein
VRLEPFGAGLDEPPEVVLMSRQQQLLGESPGRLGRVPQAQFVGGPVEGVQQFPEALPVPTGHQGRRLPQVGDEGVDAERGRLAVSEGKVGQQGGQ